MVIISLVAWTPNEPNPPYLSINYRQNHTVSISIRERGENELGKTAQIELTKAEFQDVLDQLKKNINYKSNEGVLLEAVKACYMKHQLDSDVFGWEEIGTILLDALCNTLGDKGFQEWLELVAHGQKG